MNARVAALLLIAGLLCLTERGFCASDSSKKARKNPPVQIESTAKGPAHYNVQIDITDILGHDIPSRVELRDASNSKPVAFEVPKGHEKVQAPPGAYKAYVYVYWEKVPFLVDVQDVTVKDQAPAFILVNLLEGSGDRPLPYFDQDQDFAIDSVELKCGTNPADASSIPGKERLPFDDKVISKKEGWYRGELHAHSSFGIGKETPAQLVKRAEKLGLDFLAITDLNTMDACKDPRFKSDSVVLIPSMEWGSKEKGIALLYGPRTFPEFVDSIPRAQALVDLVQAQGGFFAIAHPCSPLAPWQWGLSYVNGIEVWCRAWNGVPPMALEQLQEDLKERDKKGRLIQSIAFAAEAEGLSANGQACVFYDCESVRGLKAAVIAGSYTSGPAVPMASPVTYVYAVEKSVKGILNGLRRGRTFVSSGLNGPTIGFTADVLKDGVVDASYGGVIPLGVKTEFAVTVKDAKGKEIQVLLNGRIYISKTIDSDAFGMKFEDTPDNYSEYRVRIVGKAAKDAFGMMEMYAMTSPIFAENLNIPATVKFKDATDKKLQQELRKNQQKERELVRGAKSKRNDAALPANPTAGEIVPKGRY